MRRARFLPDSGRSPSIAGASLIALFLFLAGGDALAAGPPADAPWAPGEVVFRLKDTAPADEAFRIGKELEGDLHEEIAEIGFDTIRRIRSRSKNTEALIEALQRNPHVAYAEPNYVVSIAQTPDDPSYSQLWGLAKIQAPAAWDLTTGAPSVVVGVVDTGADSAHADLSANVWTNPGTVNDCPAGTRGYNAIARSCDPQDDNGHGTHVSGTIGAVGNNGIGVTGVNWTVAILPLKFLDRNGSGYTADAVAAIDWAIRARDSGVNVRVLNNSWGGGGFSQALLDIINKAGSRDILFVAAAGNNGANLDRRPMYPASYRTENEIAVAATDSGDRLASFSAYGPNTVHLGAPGVSILSTVPGNAYAVYSGTSMATPHVSGAAALVLSRTGCDPSVPSLISSILNNVDYLPSLAGLVRTNGRLNVSAAVRNCTGAPAPDFSLSIAPSSIRVGSGGGTVSYNVYVARTGGFSGDVGFTIAWDKLPSGIAAAFSPVSTSGNSSVLTVTVSPAVPAGSYPFTVTGTSGSASRTAAATLSKSRKK